MYSVAQIYPNYAYAYYMSVFCVYQYVHIHTYIHKCPFVMHSHVHSTADAFSSHDPIIV